MTGQHVNVLSSGASTDPYGENALSSEIRYRRHRIVWDVRPETGTPYWTGKAAVVALGDGSIQTRIQAEAGSYRDAKDTRIYLISAAKTWIDKRIAESAAPDSEYGSVVLWNEGFSVGIRKIDSQHQELIKIINLLVENEDASGHSETIASVLDRMTKYAHYHFETEEALMLDYNYPGYESQRDEHAEFKAKTAKFCLDALQRKETLPYEVLSYLRSWLTHHILDSDMKYKPYFTERGVS